MGQYRAADVLLPPGLVSLLRVPLAAAFPCVVSNPAAAIGVLAAAGVSDIVDGWLARRFSMATATGAVIDGATDKLFVATVAITLLANGYFSLQDVFLLSIREIAEAPLVAWWMLHRAQRQRRAENPKANVLGKLATVMQFGAVVLALLNHSWRVPAVWGVAGVGLVAAIVYWARELAALSPTRLHESGTS